MFGYLCINLVLQGSVKNDYCDFFMTLRIFLTEFDPADCPQDCSRPCEIVCPANAISLEKEKSSAGHLWNTNDEGKKQVLVLYNGSPRTQAS